ncbi:uncharacterized protein [Lepeophtheirus salmonis]|uniref:uncharacterized protein n=1 Tax=Lepeophtheirus salmonis TaxID=72036 RepID=UPI001AE11685|nr:uncharacterized protein LOC121124858 [Lepeophtheirus salmonis]
MLGKEEDFITNSVDKRHGKGREHLKNDTDTSVWPKQSNVILKPPDNFSFSVSPIRPTRAFTSSQRLQLEHQPQDTLESEMFNEEEVHTSTDMFDKLSQETLPSGFLIIKAPKLSLVKLEATEDKGLEIKASLEIEDNLTLKVFLQHQRICNTSFSHCLGLKSNKINSVTEAINISGYLGSKEQLTQYDTCEVIMSLLYRLKESQDLEIPQTSKLEFLIEQ